MSTKITTKKLAKNLILSIIAQIISLATSFILNFIVPKFIDENQYSYWQAFILYMGYVGVLHFGLLDGIVLRYSQYDYEELDKAKLRSQFQFLLTFNAFLTIITCILSYNFLGGAYKYVGILVGISIITKNVFTYTSYTFQITNRIKKYAFLVIVQKLIFAIFVILLLLLRVNHFYWYCIADIFGEIIAVLLGMFFNKGMYFGKGVSLKETLKESKLNVSAGIILMIANFSSSLLVGGAKMIVNWRWDNLTFGKVSYSFSATNLFLNFVTAISVVLFPSLKRMSTEDLPDFYGNIRKVISPLLFCALALYFPLCKILEMWLPKYVQSLYYIGILLPIIIFASKVSLLTDNYLKAYRKEKSMLIINLIAVTLGMTMFLICAYVLKNLDLLLYSVVFIVFFRSVLSEIVVMKIIGKNFIKEFIIELILTVAFIFITVKVDGLVKGFVIYTVILCAYLIYEYFNKIIKLFKKDKSLDEEK